MIIGLLVAGPVQQAFAGPTGGVVAVGDFDGDGDSDVMFKNNIDHEIATWRLENLAIFTGGGFGGLSATLEVRGVAFFDGDKISDLLVWDSASNDLWIWFMGLNMAGQVTIADSAFLGNTGGQVPKAVGQFNPTEDSGPDIVLQDGAGNVGIWFTLNGVLVRGGFVGNPSTAYDILMAGDFSNDGVDSIVFWNASAREVAFWDLTGELLPGGGGAVEIARGSGFVLDTGRSVLNDTGDLNNDSKDDLIVQLDNGDLWVWFMSADAMTQPTPISFAFSGMAGVNKAVALAQLNPLTDKSPDVFLEDRTTAPGEVNVGAWLLNNGNFVGGGFVGAPPDKYAVVNAGE